MGSVYEASHTRVDRLFAIKVLNVKLAKDKEAMARFEREAMLGSRLGHDHIVSVIDFDYTPEGFPYLVMERLNGRDLSRELKKMGAFTLERSSSVIRQVGVALAAAHAEGVVHRDLKPENIFLCARQGGGEQIKVMDFGISKVLTSDSIMTSHATILGTPWYMAPEQAEGKVEKIDHRSDLFALGAIFYHMLAGEMPFGGDNVPSVLFQVVHGEPRPLHELCPDLPLGVVNLINKAMSKRRGERFQSASEMVDTLAAVMGDRWKDVLVYESGAGHSMSGDMPLIQIDSSVSDIDDIALSGTISVALAPTPPVVDEPIVVNSRKQPKELGTAATVAGTMETGQAEVASRGDISPAGVLDSLREKRRPTRPRTTLSRGSGEVKLESGPLSESPADVPTRRLKPLAAAAAVLLVAGVSVALYFKKEGPSPAGDAPQVATLETNTAAAPAPAAGKVQPGPVAAGKTRPAPATGEAKPAAVSKTQPTAAPSPAPGPSRDAPAVAVKTRSLSVRSRPRGARVTVDGKALGKTPLEKQIVLQKALKVKIQKRGHAAVSRSVTAGVDPVELNVTLRPLPASINVVALHKGKPVEADIYLNGRKVDQTPAELSDLKPGRYTLKLKCTGYKTVTKKVRLSPGKHDRIAVGMVRR